jgi:hypothetical protein
MPSFDGHIFGGTCERKEIVAIHVNDQGNSLIVDHALRGFGVNAVGWWIDCIGILPFKGPYESLEKCHEMVTHPLEG